MDVHDEETVKLVISGRLVWRWWLVVWDVRMEDKKIKWLRREAANTIDSRL